MKKRLFWLKCKRMPTNNKLSYSIIISIQIQTSSSPFCVCVFLFYLFDVSHHLSPVNNWIFLSKLRIRVFCSMILYFLNWKASIEISFEQCKRSKWKIREINIAKLLGKRDFWHASPESVTRKRFERKGKEKKKKRRKSADHPCNGKAWEKV